jgi:hypothetical protein
LRNYNFYSTVYAAIKFSVADLESMGFLDPDPDLLSGSESRREKKDPLKYKSIINFFFSLFRAKGFSYSLNVLY